MSNSDCRYCAVLVVFIGNIGGRAGAQVAMS
jgi:hypothetical protein